MVPLSTIVLLVLQLRQWVKIRRTLLTPDRTVVVLSRGCLLDWKSGLFIPAALLFTRATGWPLAPRN